MKNSFQFRLTMVSILFVTVIIVACLFMYNRGSYYFFEVHAKNNLKGLYNQVDELFTNSSLTEEELKNGLAGLENPDNAYIVVSDESGKIYTTTNEKGPMFDSLNSIKQLVMDPTYIPEDSKFAMEIHQDPRMNGGYYDLVGYLSNGYMIVIRTSKEAIENNASFSNKVFFIFSINIIIMAAIVISLICRFFTKPIHDMADVATKMSELDFDAKVVVKSDDEIGRLGKSMNHLSKTLEATISDLKTANVELHHDIENKIQIDEMRKEFLSHVSHELKTPIALIQGYAEGLKESVNDDPESKDFYCDVIIDEANKMNEMVKKLLSLNEIEFGQNQIKVNRFDLVELIHNICEKSEVLFENSKFQLIFEENGPVYVWADEYLIEEVLTNYITNAFHYVSENGVIRIYFKHLDGEIQVIVFNTEEHIPEEELEKLWIKFYKVDKARTREYGGSGIGLSIVAAAMETHGKCYGVRNVPDGIEFYCNLDTNIS